MSTLLSITTPMGFHQGPYSSHLTTGALTHTGQQIESFGNTDFTPRCLHSRRGQPRMSASPSHGANCGTCSKTGPGRCKNTEGKAMNTSPTMLRATREAFTPFVSISAAKQGTGVILSHFRRFSI